MPPIFLEAASFQEGVGGQLLHAIVELLAQRCITLARLDDRIEELVQGNALLWNG